MMQDQPTDRHNILPTDVYGRVALGLLSLGFIPFAGAFVVAPWYGLLVNRHVPRGFAEWSVHVAIQEFFITLFLVALSGLIWSVAMPKWLPPFANRFARKMAILLLIPYIILIGLYFWPVN